MTKKPSSPEEDEEQSKRFLQTAKELEAAGELDPTEGDVAFERALKRAAPPRRRPG